MILAIAPYFGQNCDEENTCMHNSIPRNYSKLKPKTETFISLVRCGNTNKVLYKVSSYLISTNKQDLFYPHWYVWCDKSELATESRKFMFSYFFYHAVYSYSLVKPIPRKNQSAVVRRLNVSAKWGCSRPEIHKIAPQASHKHLSLNIRLNKCIISTLLFTIPYNHLFWIQLILPLRGLSQHQNQKGFSKNSIKALSIMRCFCICCIPHKRLSSIFHDQGWGFTIMWKTAWKAH